MSRSQILAASVMAAAFSVPTLFGVVILLPQTKAWVRWIGASVVFFAAPVFFAALGLVSSYVETFSEEFYWILLWILGAIVYWVLLRPLPSMSLDTEVNKDGEQGAPSNDG